MRGMSHAPILEACEKVGTNPVFQPEQMVCGRAITRNPPYPNTATYYGKMIVFCTHYCLEAFQADPERFFAAHSRSKT